MKRLFFVLYMASIAILAFPDSSSISRVLESASLKLPATLKGTCIPTRDVTDNPPTPELNSHIFSFDFTPQEKFKTNDSFDYLFSEPLNIIDDKCSLSGNDLESNIGKAILGTNFKSAPPFYSSGNGNYEIKTGTYFQKDISYKGSYYTSRMNLDSTDSDEIYQMTNIYNLGDTINIQINKQTGEVSIPRQCVYMHPTYGEISIVPIEIRDGKFFLAEGDLKGCLLSDNAIALGSWGVMVTADNKYYGNLYNVFLQSEWVAANGFVKVYNFKEEKTETHDILLKQISDNEALACGITGLEVNDALMCRLTPDKRLIISPQVIYNNLLYGSFCNFPATYTQDSATGQWKVSINSKSSMTFTENENKTLVTPGYVIAAKSSPSQYIGYAFKDVELTIMEQLSYPNPIPMDFEGNGTDKSPYLLKTVNDLKALAYSSYNR